MKLKRLLSLLLLAVLAVSSVPVRAQDTPGTIKFPSGTDSLDSLFRTANRANSTLDAGIDDNDTTLTLVDASTFPASGSIQIDDEIIYYTGKSSNDLTGLVRAREGTAAASHSGGATVSMRIHASHHTAHSNAIIAMQTKYPGDLTGILSSNGTSPVVARTITGTANQITVTNGNGATANPTLSLPADVVIPTVLTTPNTGLHLLDTNASHDLIIAPGSNISADRTLTLTTGDSDRTITLSGNPTLSDWFDQNVKTTGTPQHARLGLGVAADSSSALYTTGVIEQNVGGGAIDPLDPPFQVGASTVRMGTSEVYADSGAGNIFHFSAFVRNSGTRHTVAVFGAVDATGAGSSGFGANFGAYANHATANVQGMELNFATLVSGGTSYGLVITYAGTEDSPGNFLLMNSNNGDQAANGIIISNAGTQPIESTGSLFKTSGDVQVTDGVDFTSGTISGSAFKSDGFSVSGAGAVVGLSFTGANIYGGTSAGSTLTLKGTSNGSPSGAHILLNTIASGALPGAVLIGAPTANLLSGAVLHIQNPDETNSFLVIDQYSSGSIAGNFVFRAARGTAASPTATQSGDPLGVFGARGYQTTTGAFATGNNARIGFFAAENFTSTAQGTSIRFNTTPTGSTTNAERWRIEHGGWFIGQELTANPTTAELTADAAITIYTKADKLVFAYNNGGTMTYITLDLDGSDTSLTHGTSAP